MMIMSSWQHGYGITWDWVDDRLRQSNTATSELWEDEDTCVIVYIVVLTIEVGLPKWVNAAMHKLTF